MRFTAPGWRNQDKARRPFGGYSSARHRPTDKPLESCGKNHLNFLLLSDLDGRARGALGIAHLHAGKNSLGLASHSTPTGKGLSIACTWA